jgi:hypothetical protein
VLFRFCRYRPPKFPAFPPGGEGGYKGTWDFKLDRRILNHTTIKRPASVFTAAFIDLAALFRSAHIQNYTAHRLSK